MHSLAAWYWSPGAIPESAPETKAADAGNVSFHGLGLDLDLGSSTTGRAASVSGLKPGRALHSGHTGEHFIWNQDALQLFLTQLGAAVEGDRNGASARRMIVVGSSRERISAVDAGSYAISALGREPIPSDILWAL